MSVPTSRPARRPEDWALVGLLSFTAVALAGYGGFGLRPENLSATPWATQVFAVSFPLFARAHIAITAIVLAVALTRYGGSRWIPALLVVYVVTFTAEHVGTGFGVPFSGYSYTALLGPKLAGRVPYLIPLSWFLMAAPAFIMARSTFSGRGRAPQRVLLAAVLLTVWDLSLDPAMSFLTPYWVWEQSGPFYGMPWVNLLGWLLTGCVVMACLEVLDRVGRGWSGSVPVRWAALFYGAVLLMPLGMVALAGLWWSVLATLGCLTALWFMHLRIAGRDRPGAPGDRTPSSEPIVTLAGRTLP